MKKNYTAFLLLVTIIVFAQNKKIKETSEKGHYFKQAGDKVEVWNGVPSENGVGAYTFGGGSKEGTLEVKGAESKASFSSPNDVVVVKDASGNKYWTIIDGTVVKSELAGDRSSSTKEINTVPAQDSASVISKENEKAIEVLEAPIPVTPLKKGKVGKKAIPAEVIAPVVGVAEVTAPEVVVQEEKKNISIEETEIPEEAIIKFDEKIKDVTVPTDSVSTESTERIEVQKEEIGDVSELFEKNYEDMSRKEKKIYKKNEKKIMKQLESELKKSQD